MATSDKRLRKVSTGIALLVAANVLLMLLVAGFVLLTMSGFLGLGILTERLLFFSAALVPPGFAIPMLLWIVGQCLCLATPREAKGTGYLLTSILLTVVSFVTVPLPRFVPVPLVLSAALSSLPIVSTFFLLRFIGRLTNYLERPDLQKLCRSTLILWVSSFVTFLAMAASQSALVALGDIGMYVTVILRLLIAILCVISYISYLRLLELTRRATLARSHAEQAT